MFLHIFMLTSGLFEQYEVGPESFGVVVFRLAGSVSGVLGGAWISFSPKSDWKSEISVRILKRGQALSVWPSLSWMAVPLNVALICEFVLGGCCPLRLSAPSWGATILQTPRWGVAKLIGANLVIGLAYFSSSQKCHLLNRVSAV